MLKKKPIFCINQSSPAGFIEQNAFYPSYEEQTANEIANDIARSRKSYNSHTLADISKRGNGKIKTNKCTQSL